MIRTRFIITLAFAAGCLLATAGPVLAQRADITGAWELTVTPPNGTQRTAPLALKDDAGKIVGTLSAPQAVLPVEATVKEKAVTIAFTAPTQNGPLSIVLVGIAEGAAGSPASSMSGTADLGAQGQGKWTASRTASASSTGQSTTVDVTGAWAFAVEFGGGSGTPTMTFKQEGEKLTGQYVGQLGEAPLSGAIKGNAIDFTIDLTIEGNALTIRYTGTVEGAAMKGTVKLGDMGEGTFTATKKKP
jgi:hypothetical protein